MISRMSRHGLLGAALCAFAFVSNAAASQLIVNGGFETGDFTGWVLTNAPDDPQNSGTFTVTNDTVTPLNGNPTVGPASGTYYAVSDQFGSGSYAITQTFLNPLDTVMAILSFDVFVNDVFDIGGSPQIGQVDLLAFGADPITGTPVQIFYSDDTFVVGGEPNPYVHVSLDITSFLTPGQSYQIRVLDSDTAPLNVGVDNVSILTTASGVPEPALGFPVALAAGVFACIMRRKPALNSNN